jgi:hypothetical protein
MNHLIFTRFKYLTLIWRPSNAESKTMVKIIYTYTHCNLWHHRQFITIFYQFLYIRIKIIHGSHMYILFLPRVGLYVSFLPLANTRGKTSWHKGLPVVKTLYTYGFHELLLKYLQIVRKYCSNYMSFPMLLLEQERFVREITLIKIT